MKKIVMVALIMVMSFLVGIVAFANDDPYFPRNPTSDTIKGDSIVPGKTEKPEDEIGTVSNRSFSLQNVNKQIVKLGHVEVTEKHFYGSNNNPVENINYADGFGRPRGIVIHETSNSQSTINNEILFMQSNWENAFVHGYVDQNNIIEVRPTNLAAWGAGRYANPYFIHIELVEHPGNKTAFYKSISNQAYYAALLLKKYALSPSRANPKSVQSNPVGSIWSHSDVSYYLGGTDHGDPIGYFATFGYSFDNFYNLVQYYFSVLPDVIAFSTNLPNGAYTTLTKGYDVHSIVPKTAGKDSVLSNSTSIVGEVKVSKFVTTSTGSYALIDSEKISGWINSDALTVGWFSNSIGEYYVSSQHTIPTNNWKKIDNTWYYFDQSGKMATGWLKKGNKWYYLSKENGKMITGWLRIGTDWYYFNSGGQMVTGWLKNGGHWYYIEPVSGKMFVGWHTVEGKKYYFKSYGPATNGWLTLDGKKYYFSSESKGAMAVGTVNIGGKNYLFDNNGSQISSSGIISSNGRNYFINQDSSLFSGQKTIDGIDMYFDKFGVRQKGVIFIDGKSYLFSEGKKSLVTGWVKKNDKWFYYDLTSGNMKTSWLKISNKWFFLNDSGDMVVGWKKVWGVWYFFGKNGEMVKNWQWIANRWYFFEDNGHMKTGWRNFSGTWYYMAKDGSMCTNWQRIGNKWYFFHSSGYMYKGWHKSLGKWYYLYNNGSMAANTIIDGYRLNGSGTY